MKKVIILFAVVLAGLTMSAQYPYLSSVNNEDEVVHLEQWQQHAAQPLQAIVKLQDYSNFTILEKSSKSKASSSSRVECPAIQAVLDDYIVERVEQLCPTFVMPKEPRRSSSYGGGEVRDHDLSQLYLITLNPESPKREHELIEALSALAEVEYAEPNYLCFALGAAEPATMVADATYTSLPSFSRSSSLSSYSRASSKSGAVAPPNDPMYSLQWGIPACGIDSLLTAPKRNASWRPIIAIIDTGVDIDHPDLNANIWTNPAEQNGAAGQDDDNNGFRDDVHGWDFVNQTGDIHDFNSHGTHCAGIAGAVTNNGIGIAGACPDAWIMPVCVMQSDGTGDIATIVRGINYAAQNGADVISMSLGTSAYSAAMEQALAVAYQTTIIVAAAGNDHYHIQHDICGEDPCVPMFPGALSFVLGVQATSATPDQSEEHNGMLAPFSNIDNDGGPLSSSFAEHQLYNYELSAPGVGIMSTVPNGGYRQYNGTSMATPLVAGGIASLLQRRHYQTWEILWADLINYSQAFYPVDFWTVYNADSIAPAVLQCIAIEVNDSAYGDSSMYADAGERVQLYPTIRTVWGPCDSIYIWLEFQEFEDTNTVEILSGAVPFVWPLSSYAHSKSLNPIDIRIAPNVVDGRRIKLTLCAATTDAQDTLRHKFTLTVTNGVKLHGMIMGNYTLYPNVQYIVTQNLALPSGDTLFIKPGTTVKIKDGCSINATIMAIGKPDSVITFTKTDLGTSWHYIVSPGGIFDYCIFEYPQDYPTVYCNICGEYKKNATVNNSVYRYRRYNGSWPNFKNVEFYNSNILYNPVYGSSFNEDSYSLFWNTNFIGNVVTYPGGNVYTSYVIKWNSWQMLNMINYISSYYDESGVYHVSRNDTIPKMKGNNIFGNYGKDITCVNSAVTILTPDSNYYGSAREDTIRHHIYDFETPGTTSFAWLDLSTRLLRPSSLTHGIVWKVLVNGFDPQDEADSVEYLGVGTHRFDVYFNRAMDTSITPNLAMGVRSPYTQTPINKNASWSADSTIYTAYLTLTGRDAIDGVNRIYVGGAKDNEHFDIPIENQRFEVQVASSGSMSAGFQATPGIGKVDLEWNDQEVNYADFLGFNIYRYQYDSIINRDRWGSPIDTIWAPTDTIRLNTSLVQDTMFTDFNVIPGERYYYFYKILSTSLTENSPSKTVSCVPYSTIPGDANGSMNVDVADVITTINYVTGQNPQPFLFEAADVNGDGTINVLDIVSIINIILYPNGRPGTQGIPEPQTAVYTLENDTLFIDTPTPLAGLQFTLTGCSRSDVTVLPALAGFECATVEQDGNLTMIFYSMSGMTVPVGKTPLLKIQNPEFGIQSIALSDAQGSNVIAMNGNLLGLVDIETVQAQFSTAYPNPFSGKTRLELTVGNYRSVSVVFTDMTGRQVDSRTLATPEAGKYSMTWDATGKPRGIYFATLYADGMKAQTIKLIVK